MITIKTRILGIPELAPVQRAAATLSRDIRSTCLECELQGMNIILQKNDDMPAEAYIITADENLLLQAGDAL